MFHTSELSRMLLYKWSFTRNEEEDIFITVKFFVNLRSIAPPKKTITLLKGSTINTILDMFSISNDVKLILLINGSPH